MTAGPVVSKPIVLVTGNSLSVATEVWTASSWYIETRHQTKSGLTVAVAVS